MLRLVEIELHNNCNRKCDWCSNKLIEERQTCFDCMDEITLINIIADLNRMNYQGYISFSRYNEPFKGMYDEDDFWQMELLKNHLPNCTFVSNTNGDYLDKGSFDLISLYINELTIMNYDGLTKEKMISNLNYWANRDMEIQEVNKGLYTEYNGMKILYANWEGWNITDRGGLLESYSHTERCFPCYEPYYFIGINWDGTVSPCCNIRSPQEFPEHIFYTLGNINQTPLKDMLESNKMKEIKLMATEHWQESPCEFCQNTGGRYTREKGGIMYD